MSCRVIYGIISSLMVNNTANLDWPIIGNRPIVEYLKKTVVDKNVSHAYLFTGLSSLGKLTCAQFFASSLLCQNYHLRINKDFAKLPCQKCDDCLRLAKRSHPDVFFVQKEENKKDISLEQIQSLRYSLKMSSFYNSYKFGIIDQAEYLNQSSNNALLKTLEEPTPNTVIILIASTVANFPKTIISRCQVFNWQPVSSKEIEEGLIERGLPREQVYTISHLSMGKPGLALFYSQNLDSMQKIKDKFEGFLKVRKQSLADKIGFYYQFIGPKKDWQATVDGSLDFINTWQIIIRDLTLAKMNLSTYLVNHFLSGQIELIIKKTNLESLHQENKIIQLVEKRLKMNINPKLLIENFLINSHTL